MPNETDYPVTSHTHHAHGTAHARAPTRCGSAPPPAARRSLSTQQRSHALREADTALVVLLDERARVVRSRAPLAATQLQLYHMLH